MISIANDYSDTPAGRYVSEGPFSGERFREELLLPALRDHDSVEVDLDGVLAFGSSFLEESFGGLIRKGLTLQDLKKRLHIKSSIQVYVRRIWSYIEEEAGRRGRR